jgi:RND family efflux transporter MFP subunit
MKRWLTVLIPLLILGALIGWRLHTKQIQVAAQNQQRAARRTALPVVSVAVARLKDIVPTFEAVGSVEAPLNVKIAAKVTGRIDFLQAREGDRVTPGQVLVRMDPSEIEAQVQQQQSALAEAQYRLTQAQITQAPTDVQVNTQVRQQAAALGSAQANYNQVKQNYAAQVAAAEAAVTDAQGRVSSANAAVANAQATIRSAQANLANARAKYNRINDLYKQGFIAAQDVDDARTAVDVQQGALDVAQSQLNSATAGRDSALAQKQAADNQASIVKTKGQADIDAARAVVVQARAALEYARANRAQKPAYQQNLAALRATVAAAQAALRNAEAQRANTVLTSPLNGFVTDRLMDPGAMATPGQPILGVQSMRQVWVTVPVPEEVSRKIYVGLPTQVRFDALPGRTFAGKVVQVNPAADPQSRQFSIRVMLDNPRNQIKPGMFARVTMATDHLRNMTVVPREAVQQGATGATVTVVDAGNVARRRPVTLGASDADSIAITQGVQPGERVVTMSAAPVKDGQTVRIGGSKRGGASGAGSSDRRPGRDERSQP